MPWRSGGNDSQDQSLPRGFDRAARRRSSQASAEKTGVPMGISRPSAKIMPNGFTNSGKMKMMGASSGDLLKQDPDRRRDWRGSAKHMVHASARAVLEPPPTLAPKPAVQLSSRKPVGSQSDSSEKKIDPDLAATTISRAYRRRYRKMYPEMYLGRIVFAERLELEDKVNIGMQRLFLFGAIFAMIVYINSLGIPSSDRRAVKDLINAALELDDFREVRSIVDLREILPQISRKVKQFSVSRGSRFETPEGLEILGERMEFTAPVVLSSLDSEMQLDRPSWTLSAWVELKADNSSSDHSAPARKFSILRRPDANNRKLNCWGWYHPAEFRHGASDFHTLYPERLSQSASGDTWEERMVAVPAPNASAPKELSHEMVIVSESMMKFFRDGNLVGDPLPLHRDITDCWNPDKVELGSNGLALASVRFYPRALNDGEVREVYEEGEPLTELATGTELPRLSDSLLHQIRGNIDAANQEISSIVKQNAEENFMLSSVIDIIAIREGEELTEEAKQIMFPADSAPGPVLPVGDWGEPFLSTHERELWANGGKRTDGFTVNQWKNDATINARYWSVFEDPVYTHYYPDYQLPDFSEGSDGLCISFWYRPDELSRGHGPFVEIFKDGPIPSTVGLEQQLDWGYLTLNVGGDYLVSSWRYLTYFEQATGQTKEEYLLTAFAQEAEPVVWRHLAYQYNVSTGSISFYLDGKLVFDSKDSTKRFPGTSAPPGLFSVRDIFSNTTLVQRKADGDVDDYPDDMIPGKMAQLRLYDRLLSPEEVFVIQNSAKWPSGGDVKQCAEFKSVNDFVDRKEKDDRGRSCVWYANAKQHYQHVCSSVAAKRMCPVTCNGRRICHDGSLDPNFKAPIPRERYRVFNRVMWIKPRNNAKSVICPSRRMMRDKDEIMARCRAIKGENPPGWSGPPEARQNFTRIWERNWYELQPAQFWDCDDVEPRLDADQCEWDDSWMDRFQADFDETGTWSLAMWVRPKEGSFGQPTNFWFAVTMMSSVSPPLVLNHWNERDPQLEPWMDTRTVVADGAGTSSPRSAIWPTTLVDYANSWTMLYAQLERLPSGEYRLCASLNAIPADCSIVSGGAVFSPGQFLQAVEFTTEMLVAPIEITTEALTRGEIQGKYYREQVRMATVSGPAHPEYDQRFQIQSERVLLPFDQRVALVAPPLLFQERTEVETCVSPVTIPFFQSQKLLMKAAHCRESSCPALEMGDENATDMVASCTGKPSTAAHFGLTSNGFGSRTGYTDFLYTIADNAVLVRDGKSLSALSFIDADTSYFLIIALFHVPHSALTTALELSGDMSGNTVETEVNFRHYGYLRNDSRGQVIAMYVVLVALIVTTILVNVSELRILWSDSRKNKHEINRKGVAEIVYDFVQCGIVLVYILITFIAALRSETVATKIISDVATVPFYESEKAFSDKISEFFTAVENFNQALAWDSGVDSLAFAIMVLMLVRIIAATAVHPRTGVLTGTIMKTLNDLWHFAILFMIVFLCFGVAANLFFGEREDFADMQTALQTQFYMLLGELPDEYTEDPRIIVYVCLSSIVMFLLMLNFLLAIIVDGYMQVRTDIETSEAENEFLTDVGLSFWGDILSFRKGWPHKREVAYALRHRIRSQRVCARHLIIQGFPADIIKDMLAWYHQMDGLAIDPPFWEKPPNQYMRAVSNLMTPHGADSWTEPPFVQELQLKTGEDSSIGEKLDMIMRRLHRLEEMQQDMSEVKAGVIRLVEKDDGEGTFFTFLSKTADRAQLTLSAPLSARDSRPETPKRKRDSKKRDKHRKDKHHEDSSASEPSHALFGFGAPAAKDKKDRTSSDPPPQAWGSKFANQLQQSIATFTGAASAANGKHPNGSAHATDSSHDKAAACGAPKPNGVNGGKGENGGDGAGEGDRVCGVV